MLHLASETSLELTAADRSSWVVATCTEALLVLELVEVGAAVDRRSEAVRLTRSMSDSTLHLDHALQPSHRLKRLEDSIHSLRYIRCSNLFIYYLRQVNGMNVRDTVFVRCVSVRPA